MASEGLTISFVAQIFVRFGAIWARIGFITDGVDSEFLGAN